jgi:SNF2 family DNA or RNA helicase
MPRIEYAYDTFAVTDTSYRDRDLCKEIPGGRYADGIWTCRATWVALRVIRSLWPDIIVEPEVSQWAWDEYHDRIEPSMKMRAIALDPSLEPEGLCGDEVHPALYPYQKSGAFYLSYAECAVLADDMGTGKTAQAITACELSNHYPVLVVCPNSAKWNWAREWGKWSDARRTVQVISGTAAQRRKQIAVEADVYVINYEALRTHTRLAGYGSLTLSAEDKRPKELNAIDFNTVIVDEAHRIVDPHAKQTRAVWGVSANAEHRYALTGTPLVNTPGDLWSILHYISPDEWPGKTKFLDRYCITGFNNYRGRAVLDIQGLNMQNAQELFDLLEPRMLRRPKALVLPWLPPKVYVRRDVEMSPQQRKAYDDFTDLCYANLEGGQALALDPLTTITRQIQMASALGKIDDNGKLRLCAPSSKVDALVEVLEDMDESEPVVVFAQSRQLIELARDRLETEGISNACVWGEQSTWERQSSIDRFQAGQVRAILCTLGAGSEAITLTAASTVIFLQRSWSMVQNRQAEDRVHRPGQEASQVTIVDFVAPDSIDEVIALAIEGKLDMFESVVRDNAILRMIESQ